VLPDLDMTWDVSRGVDELVTAYRAQGLSREDLEGGKYLRIRTISQLLAARRLRDDLRWATQS
jgi:hypothetical protein